MNERPIKIAAMVCAAVALLGGPWSAEATAQPTTIDDALKLLFPRVPTMQPRHVNDCTLLEELGAPGNPGDVLFRVDHPDFQVQPFEAPVGTQLGRAPHQTPLQFELDVPQQGIPEQVSGIMDPWSRVDTEDELSVVQIELPIHQKGRRSTDEEQRQVSVFDTPPEHYCRPGVSCPPSLGRWRAALIRPDPLPSMGCRVGELQLGRTFPDELDPRSPTVSFRIIGLWSNEALQHGDRVRFAYWGHLPWRSTEHLVHEQDELRRPLPHRKCGVPPPEQLGGPYCPAPGSPGEPGLLG